MKAPHYSSSSPRPAACDVAAHAWVRVPAERLPDLRRRPGPGFNELPAGALKQADEQTVAGIAAVAHAMHQHGLDSAAFHSWGVLAAPYYMGRPAMAAALQRYRGEGAWGASPHLPPHRSLHSPSGAISQLFKMHGPNYGVGGGPGCAAEVLMAAAALLDAERVPGVWVVMSAIDPDLPPDRDGGLPTGAACVALALALTPPQARPAASASASPPPPGPFRRRPSIRPPRSTCSASRPCWTP